MVWKREFNTGIQSIYYDVPNTKATNVFNPFYLVFKKIRGCIQPERWMLRRSVFILYYFRKCALLDAIIQWKPLCIEWKRAHTHTDKSYHGIRIEHIGKQHIPANTRTHTHAHSIYRVCSIMWLPCSIAWAKSFSSLLNNYSVNSPNRISIDNTHDVDRTMRTTPMSEHVNICSGSGSFVSTFFPFHFHLVLFWLIHIPCAMCVCCWLLFISQFSASDPLVRSALWNGYINV